MWPWQSVLLPCAHLLTVVSLMAAVEHYQNKLLSIKLCPTDMSMFQIYYYHNVKCRVEMFDKDVIMLQV